MNPRHRLARASLACWVLLSPPGVVAAEVPQVPRWSVHEVALEASRRPANPYTDLTGEAVLTEPDGRSTRRALLFWDGDQTWRLRFTPDRVGLWSWVIRSPDPALDGRTGRFEVVPSDQRGGLRPMSGAPRHLEREAGSPFWFLGDTAWALFTDQAQERHDRAAALRYLEVRAGQGFNVVHAMLLSEAGWGNRGGPPFHDLARESLNPGYWQEVDSRLIHANRNGLVCGLALAWGDKRKVEPYAWGRFPSLEARLRYARYIAARYSAFNVYFLVAGEWHAEIRARGADEATVRSEFFAMGNALQGADPHHRMIAIHPMTREGSVREFQASGWMTFGDYQQNYLDLHRRILQARPAQRPIINSEYGYFLRDQNGDGVPDKDNSTSLEAMRHATWDVVMAGGYVVTGFGTTYFGGNRDPGPFDLEAPKNRPWEQQLGWIKRLFTGLEWWTLEPADDRLRCATPRGMDRKEQNQAAPPAATYWCLAAPREGLVYMRGISTELQVDLAGLARPLRARQFDPRTGRFKELDRRITEPVFAFTPPDAQDWVVVLSAPDAERPGAGPGPGAGLKSPGPATGDPAITGVLEPIREKFDLPAMAAAVVTSQGLDGLGAVGVRKRGTGTAVTLDDRWHLGSDTKAMTAALVGRLVERGQLRWDTTVLEIFPELAEEIHPEFGTVTVRHLLTHRAGVAANLAWGRFARLGPVPQQRVEAVRQGLSPKPEHTPGSAYLYSNLGYVIAGAMVERVTTNSWEAAIQREIFGPLQMTTAGFGGPGTRGQIDQPWGHAQGGKPSRDNGPAADNPPVLGPAGRVHCTLQDWARFVADLLRGLRGEPALLQKSTYEALVTPWFGGDYALGWRTTDRPWGGGTVLNHCGCNTLFYANAWVAPQRDFAILVTANQGLDAFDATDAAVGALLRLRAAR